MRLSTLLFCFFIALFAFSGLEAATFENKRRQNNHVKDNIARLQARKIARDTEHKHKSLDETVTRRPHRIRP